MSGLTNAWACLTRVYCNIEELCIRPIMLLQRGKMGLIEASLDKVGNFGTFIGDIHMCLCMIMGK